MQQADINAPNYSSQTPLIIAIKNNKLDSVKLLCKLGANVNYTSDQVYGYCPLHYAAEQEDGMIIDSLVTFGAKLNSRTFTGCTPLHLAAMKGKYDAVRWLCLNGADVNLKEFYNGYTPLHYAMIRGHYDVVPILLAFKANLTDGSQNATLKGMCSKTLWTRLQTRRTQPDVLEELCLQAIRKIFLGRNAHRNASRLPLPTCLKEKLLFAKYV